MIEKKRNNMEGSYYKILCLNSSLIFGRRKNTEKIIFRKNDILIVSNNCRTPARLLSRLVRIYHCHHWTSFFHQSFLIKLLNTPMSYPLTCHLLVQDNHLIGHCVMVKNGFVVRRNDNTMLLKTKNFEDLFHSEWGYRVNAPSRTRKKWLM